MPIFFEEKKMITAGIDVGSVTTKVVIFNGDSVLGQCLRQTGADPKRAARLALEEGLKSAGISLGEVQATVSTGYGRRLVELGEKVVTEIHACAKGAAWLRTPEGVPRTILDIGGQDSKAIALDEMARVVDFAMNDKCAAGTGRFLELIAKALEVRVEDLAALSSASTIDLQITSTCAVFAESEVISLLAQGKSREDIAAAIHRAIAERVAQLIKQVGGRSPIMFCGGTAHNYGLTMALQEKLKTAVYVPEAPDFVVALGAALIAQSSLRAY